jgi:hypothetical protein
MTPRLLALALVTCAACGAQLSDGPDPSLGNINAVPDAGGGDGGGSGGGGTAPPQCASRSVYLNFEGQKLTRGPSDAALNQASWMQIAEGTAPPYLGGNPDRGTAIQAIADGIAAQLAQFPLQVTTRRPASGSYMMLVFGGTAADVGSNFGGAVNQLDCGDARPSDVAWLSDNGKSTQRAINTAIGAIGFGLGLTATSDPRDCMCGWDNACTRDDSVACRLGSPIARDPKARQLCPDLTPQDEIGAIRTAFCR